MKQVSERAFEETIESYLLANGYAAIPGGDFDRSRAIFPSTILDFIQETQSRTWGELENLLGDQTGEQILSDLCRWMDNNGSLATLRHGFKCYGKTLRIAFFKAAHELNTELEMLYQANRLGITRQLHFSPKSEQSLDVTISLNGIPIITMELKNQLTGQTVDDACMQYQRDRNSSEPIFEFKRRTLAHFAVDTDVVMMTTRLAEEATKFIPFNKGDGGGAGNPSDPAGKGYRTRYLWEEIFEYNSLLDILARFIHLQTEDKRDDEDRRFTVEKMIFPRYHQIEAVRSLVQAAELKGVGHNYLIEHSAGSGKSNTIGWLAHRLSSLHDISNEKIFDSVVVISDRIVLDQQLQNTIYDFEHKQGVVSRIDGTSRQLAEALITGTPIIVTTLQKFLSVSDHLEKKEREDNAKSVTALPTCKYAVIIDEAHSSQGGETATELKGVLGGEKLWERARQEAGEHDMEGMERLFYDMAKRGQQENISFFAFTATPKYRTLAIFGNDGEPAHRYTMRQAIEEGFILDVLQNYTTYRTYFGLLKKSNEDPHVERKGAAQALTRFERLHPHNISQKTEIMVEHFNTFTRHKIGGRAKAMVVTGSRLEAVRYKQSFDRYIREKDYSIKSLVAFSGTVSDDKIPNVSYTEESMNHGLRQRELPEKFATSEYQILLVAEKYQTGFDQPLLHTMYIDKRLAGLQAVQTLSRLNRTHDLKEDTFVLDFVNDRNDIQEAFQAFYEGAVIGEIVDPASMYQLLIELDREGVYLPEEVERFCLIYFKPRARHSNSDHQEMNAALDPAKSRFSIQMDEDEEKAEVWRGRMRAYQNLYRFLSQIIPYQDSDLEKKYVFFKHLSPKLPRGRRGSTYDFDNEVQLEYYRLQKIAEGSIVLDKDNARPLDGPTEVGTGSARLDLVQLSQLIDILNERFGTDFNQADQLFLDQIIEAAIGDGDLKDIAEVNPKDKFNLIFRGRLKKIFAERMGQNEEIFNRFMNDMQFQDVVTLEMSKDIYQRLHQRLGIDKEVPQQVTPSENRPYSIVFPSQEERYKTCVPLIPLEIAAGGFGDPQFLEEDGFEWAEIETEIRLHPGMFLAQVVGRSMEPMIPDGAWCLFEAPVLGTRQGKIVLVQLHDQVDPETGWQYTVKRYESKKIIEGEGDDELWHHSEITLKPINPEFDPITLTETDDVTLNVIAELAKVLQ